MTAPTDDELDQAAHRLGAMLEALTLSMVDYQSAHPRKRYWQKAADYEDWVRKWLSKGTDAERRRDRRLMNKIWEER